MIRKPHRGYLPYGLESICTKCALPFGDHRSKPPHVLRMIVKFREVSCSGFVPKKKSIFAPIHTSALAPESGCKSICNHIYCDLLKRAEGENLES